MAGIGDVVAGIREKAAASPEKLKGINATYQFHLTGEGGGSFYASVKDDGVEVEEGTAETPQVTVSITAADFAGLATGQLNPVMAFMSGKIKIQGDMGLAMKLQQLLG